MTLEEAFVTRMKGNTTVKKLVGEKKVRPFSVTPPEEAPFILYRKASETKERYLSGAFKPYAVVELAVSICAADTDTISKLEAATNSVMEALPGAYEGITIKHGPESPTREDDTLPPMTGDEMPLIQVTLTYSLRVRVGA